MDVSTARRIERALLTAENEDPDALRSVLSSAPTWHTPGHNMLAGDHMGREQVVQLLKDYRDMTQGSLRVEEARGPETRGDEGTLHLHLSARRQGLMLDTEADVRFRLEEGRVAELWTQPEDAAAWDRFWAP